MTSAESSPIRSRRFREGSPGKASVLWVYHRRIYTQIFNRSRASMRCAISLIPVCLIYASQDMLPLWYLFIGTDFRLMLTSDLQSLATPLPSTIVPLCLRTSCAKLVHDFTCKLSLFWKISHTFAGWATEAIPGTHMQYTKLGFSRLFKGYGSHQVPCSLIVNHSVIPNFAYCNRWQQLKKMRSPLIQ